MTIVKDKNLKTVKKITFIKYYKNNTKKLCYISLIFRVINC